MGPLSTVLRALDDRRSRTEGLIRSLTREIEEIVDSAQLANIDDEHDPEGSTIAYERAKANALLVAATHELQAIDGAIERAHAGTYGTCVACGSQIAPERLETVPTTSTCISCARC